MNWLLDTHVFLWLAGDLKQLSPNFVRRLRSDPPPLYFSAASAWELAIKVEAGKLKLPEPVEEFLSKRLNNGGIQEIPITRAHALAAAGLAPIHRDPFDRMLAAQALLEDLTVVTVDAVFGRYGCRAFDPR